MTLVGHSLGTMVSRYFVERLGGKERVERLVLMGGPHMGAVKGLTSLLIAPQVLPFGLMGERLRQIILTFATTYQIIPTYACAVDQEGKGINFLEDESWATEAQLPLLRQAQRVPPRAGQALQRVYHLDLRLWHQDHRQRPGEARCHPAS